MLCVQNIFPSLSLVSGYSTFFFPLAVIALSPLLQRTLYSMRSCCLRVFCYFEHNNSPPHTRYTPVIGWDGFSSANHIANGFKTRPMCRANIFRKVNDGSDCARMCHVTLCARHVTCCHCSFSQICQITLFCCCFFKIAMFLSGKFFLLTISV